MWKTSISNPRVVAGARRVLSGQRSWCRALAGAAVVVALSALTGAGQVNAAADQALRLSAASAPLGAASPQDLTNGFDIWNLTSNPMTLRGVYTQLCTPDCSGIDNTPGTPAVGDVIQPGHTEHFEVTWHLFGDTFVRVSYSNGATFYMEPFSSWLCLADLQCVDGLGELAGAPGAAAELAEDAPGLELGVRALAG